MSVVADFTVPADSFVLEEALTAEPDMTVEAERLATHSTEWVLPFLWASDGDFDAFHEALQRDSSVVDATVIEEVDDSVLYQVTWSEAVNDLITEMIDQHANILEAEAHDGEWWLKLRFAEDEQVSSFRTYFADRDRTFEVEKLQHPSASRQREYGLTPEQYDTLVVASELGYFDVPRTSSMEDLANELGISSNAVSQRIRRGCANLVRHTLTVGTGEIGDGR